NNNDGTYTYTNEEGNTVTINIPGDVINNIDQILGDTNVLNELIEVLGGTYVGGNVYYDGTQFTYVDQSGATHIINLADIVKANETTTTLVNNNDGTYTYTSEDGTVTTVDVPSDIVNQFGNIVTDGPVTVDGNTYNTIEEYIEAIVKQNETLTSATFDAATGILTYNDEAGTANTIDLSTLVSNFETLTSITQEAAAGTITYVDEAGTPTTLNIADIIAQHQTTTTLVNNNDGTYTLPGELPIVTTVDVPSDIVNQFGNIVTDGPVTVDGNTYNTIEEYIEHIVSTAETTTTLVN